MVFSPTKGSVTAIYHTNECLINFQLFSLNCCYFTFAIPVMHIVIGSHAVLLLSSADLPCLIFYLFL
jgi:uncharacterized membrane protein (UPF0182 family)